MKLCSLSLELILWLTSEFLLGRICTTSTKPRFGQRSKFRVYSTELIATFLLAMDRRERFHSGFSCPRPSQLLSTAPTSPFVSRSKSEWRCSLTKFVLEIAKAYISKLTAPSWGSHSHLTYDERSSTSIFRDCCPVLSPRRVDHKDYEHSGEILWDWSRVVKYYLD